MSRTKSSTRILNEWYLNGNMYIYVFILSQNHKTPTSESLIRELWDVSLMILKYMYSKNLYKNICEILFEISSSNDVLKKFRETIFTVINILNIHFYWKSQNYLSNAHAIEASLSVRFLKYIFSLYYFYYFSILTKLIISYITEIWQVEEYSLLYS